MFFLLAAPFDVGELGFFLFSERARTKSLDTAFDPSKLLGSEADALGCGRGAHHDVVVPIWIEHACSIAHSPRNTSLFYCFFCLVTHLVSRSYGRGAGRSP